MAAFTVAQCIAQAQFHMSDFPLASNAQALTIANYVQSDIVRVCPLYPAVVWPITLIQGQQEYSLDPSIIHINSAIWQGNSNISSQIVLIPTSIDQLDYDTPNWRSMSPAVAYKYYEYGGMLGIVPPPSVPTIAGYPIVNLYTSVEQPFASTSSSLPSQVPTPDAWVWGMCARWAAMQRRDDAAGFADLATAARSDLIRFINGRLLRQKATIRASYNVPRNL